MHWSDFDIVGFDLFLDTFNLDTYLEQLRSYYHHGKPVVADFGCCSHEGTEDKGDSGNDLNCRRSAAAMPATTAQGSNAHTVEPYFSLFRDRAAS